jgi:hypothetical protein
MIVALEDAQDTMLKPVETPKPESIEAIEAMTNLGEFPTLPDQSEERSYPNAAARKR